MGCDQVKKRRHISRSGSARGAFWLSLLALHAAAVPSLWGALVSPTHAGDQVALVLRLVAMFGSSLFFLLKVLDVPSLRLCPGWRSVVAAIVVVGVLHVGVIDRAVTGGFETDPAHIGLVFFVGSLCYVDSLAACLRMVLAVLMPMRVWRTHLGDYLDRVWEAVHPAPRPVLVPAYIGPRAPPQN